MDSVGRNALMFVVLLACGLLLFLGGVVRLMSLHDEMGLLPLKWAEEKRDRERATEERILRLYDHDY